MATITEYDPSDFEKHPLRPSPRQAPLRSSLAAAATRINKTSLERIGSRGGEAWQEDAWDMYDLVGEQRFLARTLASRMGQARFFVSRLPEDPTEDIQPLGTIAPTPPADRDGEDHRDEVILTPEERLVTEVFESLAGARTSFAQMIERCGINLFIPGDGWLVGEPPRQDLGEDPSDGIPPVASEGVDLSGVRLEDLKWSMRSVSEVKFKQGGEVVIEDGSKNPPEYSVDDLVMVRIWRPHPRRWWDADSPTRSSLPVLRELVGLTMHISAQVDSRLAGAGVLFVPDSADRAIRASIQTDPQTEGDNGEDVSPLVDAFMESMITPINDRSSASALVPIMPVLPDESIDKFRYMSFAVPLDTEARPLRDEAIRRLALGQDCPPELLLGVGGMNHWGAWLVREDVVTSHLEPPLALICDALTTQFLWPVLEQHGVEDFEQFVIWYDVDHLIIRPDRSRDAKDLHGSGVLSDDALRKAAGFGDLDAPQHRDPAVALTFELAKAAPSLLANPGLAVLLEQIQAMMAGAPAPPLPDAPPIEDTGGGSVKETEADPGEESLPDTADAPAGDSSGLVAGGVTSGTAHHIHYRPGPVMVPYTHHSAPAEEEPTDD